MWVWGAVGGVDMGCVGGVLHIERWTNEEEGDGYVWTGNVSYVSGMSGIYAWQYVGYPLSGGRRPLSGQELSRCLVRTVDGGTQI